MSKQETFLAVADFLIPAYKDTPRFSDACSFEDARIALGFRVDLKEGFERDLLADMSAGAEPALEKLNAEDGEAFTALAAIALCAYYMNPTVRETIGYPGRGSVFYDPKAPSPISSRIAGGDRPRPQIPPDSGPLVSPSMQKGCYR